jgi:hypothetical protein
MRLQSKPVSRDAESSERSAEAAGTGASAPGSALRSEDCASRLTTYLIELDASKLAE